MMIGKILGKFTIDGFANHGNTIAKSLIGNTGSSKL